MKFGALSRKMGHQIRYNEEKSKWFYCDTEEECNYERPCVKCKKYATIKGHDPCIANLEGVTNACCGHGVEEGYVQFKNGLVIRGYFDHIKMD
jgi:hypothetical protein